MSMKTKAAILVSSAAILLFMVVGSLDGVRASSNDGAYRQLQVYSEVLSRVRSEYVEEPNIPQVTDGALHGLLESLDANSSYLSRSASDMQPWFPLYPAGLAIKLGFRRATSSKLLKVRVRAKCR